MADKVEQLREEYKTVPAVVVLCESLSASAAGVHGRALERDRPDDKRLTTPPMVSYVPREDRVPAS